MHCLIFPCSISSTGPFLVSRVIVISYHIIIISFDGEARLETCFRFPKLMPTSNPNCKRRHEFMEYQDFTYIVFIFIIGLFYITSELKEYDQNSIDSSDWYSSFTVLIFSKPSFVQHSTAKKHRKMKGGSLFGYLQRWKCYVYNG
jgi:hypothetical protein